ncbi:MAG: hypothetical protein OXD44_03765, partial [Gammaproteobacteria bacterium]|nr:hypothetical protein [Gammaproteobacteria bacterium]
QAQCGLEAGSGGAPAGWRSGKQGLERFPAIEAAVTDYLRDRIEGKVAEGNDRERDVAALCAIAGSVAGAHHAVVLAQGPVANPVIDFHSPVPSIPGQQLLGIRSRCRRRFRCLRCRAC